MSHKQNKLIFNRNSSCSLQFTITETEFLNRHFRRTRKSNSARVAEYRYYKPHLPNFPTSVDTAATEINLVSWSYSCGLDLRPAYHIFMNFEYQISTSKKMISANQLELRLSPTFTSVNSWFLYYTALHCTAMLLCASIWSGFCVFASFRTISTGYNNTSTKKLASDVTPDSWTYYRRSCYSRSGGDRRFINL